MNTAKIFHPIANLFEHMSIADFSALKNDIEKNGQLTPILRWRGLILDGRHRYSACVALGIEPKYDDLQDSLTDGEALKKTLSLNLHRRHLTLSQKALLGATLAQFEKGSNQHTAKAVTSATSFTQQQVADLLKISADSIQRAKQIKDIPELVQAVNNNELSLTEAARLVAFAPINNQKQLLQLTKEIRQIKLKKVRSKLIEAQNFKTQKLPQKKYSVLYLDPPWDYKNKGGSHEANPRLHYHTMTTQNIAELPVKTFLNANAIIFLWATSFHLKDALTVLEAWGLKYLTTMIWTKPNHVIGSGIFKMSHEILLVAKRGAGLGQPVKNFISHHEAKSAKHSQKPEHFRKMIEDMYPQFTKLELFARSKHSGWDSWGNQK